MTQKKRDILIYAIGTLAFIIALFSLALGVCDAYALYTEAGGNLSAAGIALYDTAVDLVFAALELTLGFTLIKEWRAGEHIEIHKTVSQLINAIVYASFVKVLLAALLPVFTTHAPLDLSIGTLYVAAYLIFGILMSGIPIMVKKHQLMELYWVMLFSSAVAVGFCIYDTATSLSQADTLMALTDGANALLSALITLFALANILHYLKNPLLLDRDVRENEDAEVISATDKYETVRIYATRGTHDKTNTLINVLTACSVLFGFAAILLFAQENNLAYYLTGNVGSIVDAITNALLSLDTHAGGGILIAFLCLFVHSLVYLSLGSSIFNHRADAKLGVLTVTSTGLLFTIIHGAFLFLDVFREFSLTHTLGLENYSIFEILLVLLYIVYSLTKKVYANLTKEINDGIATRGDSYHMHSKTVARVTLFSGLYSCAAYALFFAMHLTKGSVNLSYVAFFLSTVLIIIATNLEVKHPFDEYTVVKRKIRTNA